MSHIVASQMCVARRDFESCTNLLSYRIYRISPDLWPSFQKDIMVEAQSYKVFIKRDLFCLSKFALLKTPLFNLFENFPGG